MLYTPYIYLALAIIFEVVATNAMKASEGFTKLAPSLIVVVGYILAFYFLSLVLKSIPVGVAYAIWAGVGIVLISIVAALLYGQTLDTPAIIGMGFIITGVVIINVFSKTSGH